MQTDNKNKLFEKADRYKTRIDSIRPLTERENKNLEDYFKIGLTYSSNAIEGNTLTLSETKILLEDGLTVGGKPIRDYYEAIGKPLPKYVTLEFVRHEQLKQVVSKLPDIT